MIRTVIVWFRAVAILGCVGLIWLFTSWFPDKGILEYAVALSLLAVALSVVWMGFQVVFVLLPDVRPRDPNKTRVGLERTAALEDVRQTALMTVWALPFTWLFSFVAAFAPKDLFEVSRDALIGALIGAAVLRAGRRLLNWLLRIVLVDGRG
jgi:hypothetical protein